MRDLINLITEGMTTDQPEPMVHTGVGDPYATFSQSILLKDVLESESNPTVTMGPSPGTLYITFTSGLRLTVKTIGHDQA